MHEFVDFFLHLDAHLESLVNSYPTAIYAILFAIVFAETGLVVTPFLPGDSLIFAVGALAASGLFNPLLVVAFLIIAAVLGDGVNYHIGKWIGPRVFRLDESAAGGSQWFVRLLNRKHLDRAHEFFDHHGGKAVVLARFVPIIRTFVPFVAGAGAMNYRQFIIYNVAGGVAWVGICFAAGYLFGNMPVVKKHFELVILGIIAVSMIPVVVEVLRARAKKA